LKQKKDSDVGVISNVAMYSLKAKVGKLESENQNLNEKVHQLEREKATLSLLNTESRYFVYFCVCLFVVCSIVSLSASLSSKLLWFIRNNFHLVF